MFCTEYSGIPAGVHIILQHDDNVLLMRRAGTGFFDGLYSLPGGHLEAGESLFAAAVREMREETGVRLALATLCWAGTVHRLSDTSRIDFFVRAQQWSGEPVINEPDKCDHLAWFRCDALPSNTVPYIAEALQQPTERWHFEMGWDAPD